MNAYQQEVSQRRATSPQEVGFHAMIVVYQSKDGLWKGFAHPYGETTEADTKNEAIKKMRELTQAYSNILKEYDSPSHLVNGQLLDLEDREIFNRIVRNKYSIEKLDSPEGKIDNPSYYAEAYRI